MAIVTYGANLGNFGDPFDHIDMFNLSVSTKTTLGVTLVDAYGGGVTISGTDFTYARGKLTGGVIESLVFFADGIDLFIISDANLTVPDRGFGLVPFQESPGWFLFSGNDVIHGTANRDALFGAAGNDVLRGYRGEDLLIVSAGRDRLIGGAGSDEFDFKPNKGTDRIVDFADNDLASDDVIGLEQAHLDVMTKTQVGDDVLLQFGTYGALLILNHLVAEIGADDFTTIQPI